LRSLYRAGPWLRFLGWRPDLSRVQRTLAKIPVAYGDVVAKHACARLRTKGNFVYPVNVLKAITFKDVKSAGNLILPSIIIETRRGGQQRYGMPHPDFEKACEQLKKLYPELCK